MAEADPWLTIIGIGEDGPDGLSAASRAALAAAETVIGAPRHLALLGPVAAGERLAWPVPFADGLALLRARRGRRVAMLASGDPFWFGAGSRVVRMLDPGEWIAHPGPSSFALAAARLGWPLETTECLGLHAAPLTRLRPLLAPGRHLLLLLRDGAAVPAVAAYLAAQGFGDSLLHALEALGGPRERIRHGHAAAAALEWSDCAHPVALGVAVAGAGSTLPLVTGREDGWFAQDGQLTKAPVRALTLAALAPRAGERLWDIGAGSGSVAIEWLLAHPSTEAIGFEADPARAARAADTAARLGVDRLQLVTGVAPACLAEAPVPDAVFVGGGLTDALLAALVARCRPCTRLVANAVTLETEALLTAWHAARGGRLLRIDLAEAAPLGGRRGWKPRYPIVQWSGLL
ncbi:precorrin-6y C5,15-methyltransferase (decarboxylating) subunit CbiE [Sphingomonas morindae]|uniref:Precorrin-6y C5,15-methyltransferase (Decarboxylating) subunit CbiE n=1 Tax=Sphingomonas morindae TaxID=1541170 RepID=A0ABY4X6P1_9SPHN|nr:precorrin-6y C5,15-methyltransferase (decarboxylating) subunit CbiE [Sphingomonas morindae]USI72549.1 precorrin-6y C5,15-methyltransferase (decarboxylating) subunit CbiE [Sphingomonas morindae]